MKSEFIQVLVSCESVDQAKKMIDSLLNEQLVACVQLVPSIESFYRWQGQIEKAQESLLLLKTKASQFAAIEQKVKSLHSYQTPEIIAVPLENGSTEYLNWINEQIKPHN